MVVRKDGQAVMGRGVAKEAADLLPELPKLLGQELRKFGNHCFIFSIIPVFDIITFPVKPTFGPNHEPGWQVRAEIPLIKQSAYELVKFANRYDWVDVLLPRPGCGNGGLKWKDVKPVLTEILDDRFTAITWF